MNLWPRPVYMQELAPNIANVKEFAPKQEYFNTANNAGWVTRNRYILEDPALKISHLFLFTFFFEII